MSKCKNCGTEFEGNFCPECGTKSTYLRICKSCGEEVRGKFCLKCGTRYKESAEAADADVVLPSCEKTGGEIAAKICPKCGAVVKDRFCSACGTEYVEFRGFCPRCGATAEGNYCSACGARIVAAPYAKAVNPSVKRTYRALVRMPIILFLALAVFLTGAYFGRYEWGRWYSYSNVYDMYDGLSTYLFVFFVVCAATAITLFIIGMLYGTKKYKHYNLFQVFGIVGIVFMSVSCANGAVAWTSVGSTPAAVMISVFSVSCLIPSVVCLVLSKILVSDDEEYAAAELFDRKRK